MTFFHPHWLMLLLLPSFQAWNSNTSWENLAQCYIEIKFNRFFFRPIQSSIYKFFDAIQKVSYSLFTIIGGFQFFFRFFFWGLSSFWEKKKLLPMRGAFPGKQSSFDNITSAYVYSWTPRAVCAYFIIEKGIVLRCRYLFKFIMFNYSVISFSSFFMLTC